MDSIIFEAPFNSLSFGNVSFNLAREMFKKGMSVSLFPFKNSFDFSAFADKLDPSLKEWLEESTNSRFDNYKKDTPCLKVWHINGSEQRLSKNSFLYSFYELNSPTLTECILLNSHDHTFFSSSHASGEFKKSGCDNTSFVPLGFDVDFESNEGKRLDDKIHFGLIGKWEKRKHTSKIIQAWASKYGDNNDYQLTCCVVNPFLEEKKMNELISKALSGKRFSNINFINRLKTNSEVNILHNAIDIDLSGASGAEGWNLPSFNSTAKGKWSIVLNATGHKDWANEENSILMQPSGKISAYDGTFFQEGSKFNQGEIYDFSTDDLLNAMDIAVSKVKNKEENKKGLMLKDQFSYEKTLDKILSEMESLV